MSAVYPRPPVWCPSCSQAMSWHPHDPPGVRLRWRCQNCQQTWTMMEVLSEDAVNEHGAGCSCDACDPPVAPREAP